MGSVWVAEDEKLERWVAVKLLGQSVAASRSVRERFEREAMAIAKLRSPHVVQIFDYGAGLASGGAGDRHAFIVMELLSGQDLYTWLKENRPVPLLDIANIVTQVAKALSAAHRANIIHRDLKPGNVFVMRDHEEETVKVFDFGLAKGLTELSPLRELEDRTGEGVLLGTPRYMSPEQAHGAREVDHRSDLWSLTVIAYLAITGRLPFEGTGVGEVITKIATDRPKAPSVLNDEVSDDIDGFFERAFRKEPEQRYQTAMELAEAFEGACGSGRTSRELIPLSDGDTFLELTQADTEVGSASPVPPSPLPPQPSQGSALAGNDDALTVPQVRILNAPEDEAPAPISTAAPEPIETTSGGVLAAERPRPWLAGALTVALAATVVWAFAKDDAAPAVAPGAAPTVVVKAPPVAPQPGPQAAPEPEDKSPDPRPISAVSTPSASPMFDGREPDASAEPETEPQSDEPQSDEPQSDEPQSGEPQSEEPVTERALELFEDRH